MSCAERRAWFQVRTSIFEPRYLKKRGCRYLKRGRLTRCRYLKRGRPLTTIVLERQQRLRTLVSTLVNRRGDGGTGMFGRDLFATAEAIVGDVTVGGFVVAGDIVAGDIVAGDVVVISPTEKYVM